MILFNKAKKQTDELLTDLILGNFKILQKKRGYRFNIDSVLLAHFVDLKEGFLALDLGAGEGVLGLILLARSLNLQITGVEINPVMVEMAKRTITLNGLNKQMKIISLDVQNKLMLKRELGSEKFDLVVSNPPFYKLGIGKLAQNESLAIARHEVKATLEDFISAGVLLLKKEGSFFMCQIIERLEEALFYFERFGLAVEKIRFVQAMPQKKAYLFLIKGRKTNTLKEKVVLQPLCIYKKAGVYSDEVKSYYYLRGL